MFRRFFVSAAIVAGSFSLVAVLAKDPPTQPVAAHQNYTETIQATDRKVSFDMVALPGGEFVMGSPESEEGRNENEGPQIKTRVKPFWIGKHEVTWDEFDNYFLLDNANLLLDPGMGEAKSDGKKRVGADAVSKPTRPYVDETYGFEREKHPAICMTHHAAMKYCEWLSKKTGKDYRLPTEAEWEYACRAGSTTPYAIPEGADLEDYAWMKSNSGTEIRPAGSLRPVGQKKPNAWGLHDMHGNVMEWCIDHYVADAYTRYAKKVGPDGFVAAPVFRPTELKWSHVTRGGHFRDRAPDLRSAARRQSIRRWMQADPQEPQSIWWLTNYPIIGFRIVRPVEPDDLTGITSTVRKDTDEFFNPK